MLRRARAPETLFIRVQHRNVDVKYESRTCPAFTNNEKKYKIIMIRQDDPFQIQKYTKEE